MADLPSVEAYLEGKERRTRVITHRIRVTEADQLDASLEALVVEAYEDVGPGFRGR